METQRQGERRPDLLYKSTSSSPLPSPWTISQPAVTLNQDQLSGCVRGRCTSWIQPQVWSSCIPLLRIFSVDLVFLQASAILGRTDSHPPWSFQLVLGGGVELTQRAVELGFIAQGRLVRVSIETAQPEQRNNSIMSSTTSLLEEIVHFQEEDKKWKDDGNFETRKTMQIHFRYARPDRPRTGSSCGGTVPRRCWRRIVGKSGGRRSETTSRGHSDLFSLNAGGGSVAGSSCHRRNARCGTRWAGSGCGSLARESSRADFLLGMSPSFPFSPAAWKTWSADEALSTLLQGRGLMAKLDVSVPSSNPGTKDGKATTPRCQDEGRFEGTFPLPLRRLRDWIDLYDSRLTCGLGNSSR